MSNENGSIDYFFSDLDASDNYWEPLKPKKPKESQKKPSKKNSSKPTQPQPVIGDPVGLVTENVPTQNSFLTEEPEQTMHNRPRDQFNNYGYVNPNEHPNGKKRNNPKAVSKRDFSHKPNNT